MTSRKTQEDKILADFILKSLPSCRGFLFVGMVIAMFICSISTLSYLVSERESLSFILDLIATVLAMFIFTNSLVSIQSFEEEKNHFLSLLGDEDEHTKLQTKINKKEHTFVIILPIIFLFLIVLNLAWQAEQFQFYIYNELIFVVLAVIIYKGLQAKKRTSALLELLQGILSEYETKR